MTHAEFKDFDQIYFYVPCVDFSGINGLCGVVQDEMQLDLFKSSFFVFTNSAAMLKHFIGQDRFCSLKYLIEDKYSSPLKLEQEIISVDIKKLEQFLVGLDPFQIPFSEKTFKKV